ncbi:MAG: NAD(P)-binding domain-containing protein, partial [Acidobacteriota bacterium]|nr:NAD(P)-binding domain-containing protein [Acidobacteriota bacterium]
MPEVIDFLERNRRSFDAPVEEATTVLSVSRSGGGFRIDTDRGTWEAPTAVIATGQCDIPLIPDFGSRLSPDVTQIVPSKYRNPEELPEGGVLVVGAAASGIQLAEEIHLSGRPVTLAVGRHTRLPRLYRGKDILWWFDQMGIFDETLEKVHDAERSRSQPSLQLVGRPDKGSIDLITLQDVGVKLAGKVIGAEADKVFFADDLVAYTARADVKLARLLKRIDDYVVATGLTGDVGPPEPFIPFFWPAPGPESIDLRAEGIRTVLWATGFRRSYPWLKLPVVDGRGEIRHDGGVTPEAGLYVLGLQFLRRRNSNFIDGVGADAMSLAEHIADRLGRRHDSAIA